jgi:hypothetical protein
MGRMRRVGPPLCRAPSGLAPSVAPGVLLLGPTTEPSSSAAAARCYSFCCCRVDLPRRPQARGLHYVGSREDRDYDARPHAVVGRIRDDSGLSCCWCWCCCCRRCRCRCRQRRQPKNGAFFLPVVSRQLPAPYTPTSTCDNQTNARRHGAVRTALKVSDVSSRLQASPLGA